MGNERIQLAPMIEEIFTDLAPLTDKRGITLTAEGDGVMTGSDALIYRLLFNLTENAVKYNRPCGSVRVCVTQEPEKLRIRVSDTGCGIPEEYNREEEKKEQQEKPEVRSSLKERLAAKQNGR